MSKKEELIKLIINDGIDQMKKTQKDHGEQIDEYHKNGFKDTHPDNIEGIKEGLNYTHGYTFGHLCLLDKMNRLLDMTEGELENLIEKNKETDKKNKEYLKELKEKIKKGN